MASRVRCSVCRGYFDRAEAVFETAVSRICSSECLDAQLQAKRERARSDTPRARKAARARKKPPALSVEDRMAVRQRDGNRCRWCGSPRNLQVHHVRYRSEGGEDSELNLVTLCAAHHAEAHASKHRWQPVLLALLWLTYVERTLVMVPQVETRLRRDGLLAKVPEGREGRNKETGNLSVAVRGEG